MLERLEIRDQPMTVIVVAQMLSDGGIVHDVVIRPIRLQCVTEDDMHRFVDGLTALVEECTNNTISVDHILK